ncbi:TFIIB-type zinc ribbon-containing protein [Parasporobacterium paucivorans]|nr:TFIIB-type zinc ribbon-containing protein [Parasporobacterium paucivorans]
MVKYSQMGVIYVVQVISCPNCGANMRFDSEIQKMHCDHCGTEIAVDEIKVDGKEEPEETAEPEKPPQQEKTGEKTGNFKTYKCPSCGAELLTDENTSATFCGFCGNSTLIEDRLKDELMPAQLIPFKISQDEAKDIYRQWSRKGGLTPKGFREQSTIEKMTGIYVPYWLYDYHTNAKLDAHCTRVRRQIRGDVEYIHTDNFKVIRDIDAEYVMVPADASEKMPDEVMEKLEPYSYKDLLDFEMPYLSGFYAEKYNYGNEELRSRIEDRVSKYAYDSARDTIQGYATVAVTGQDVQTRKDSVKYTLLPVWMLNYRYKGVNYLFAINGQTGKLVGNLPISRGRAAGWFASIAVGCAIVLTLMGVIFG